MDNKDKRVGAATSLPLMTIDNPSDIDYGVSETRGWVRRPQLPLIVLISLLNTLRLSMLRPQPVCSLLLVLKRRRDPPSQLDL